MEEGAVLHPPSGGKRRRDRLKVTAALSHLSWRTLVCVGVIGAVGCTSSVPSADVAMSADAGGELGGDSATQSQQSDTAEKAWAQESVGVNVIAPKPVNAQEVAASFLGHVPSAWGLNVPGVITHMDSDSVAITLDACGGPSGSGFDARLIDGLIERQVPATLFLNERWIEANPDIALELANNPLFEIENHGSQHRPLSVQGQLAYGIAGTNSVAEVVEEVWSSHQAITALTGIPPKFFRSGTAHYDDVAVQIVEALGESVVGFNVNADAGATYSAESVQAAVAGAAPGSILIAHMNQPLSGTAVGLLAGVDALQARGVRFSWIENPQ